MMVSFLTCFIFKAIKGLLGKLKHIFPIFFVSSLGLETFESVSVLLPMTKLSHKNKNKIKIFERNGEN
jgi:hypothetical protein